MNQDLRHDTRHPLTCCPRCYGAELAGRALRQPLFRYDKADPGEAPVCYRLFHGEQPVATLTRAGRSGPQTYAVAVEWEYDGPQLVAPTLRDARGLAEAAYIEVWRGGRFTDRGPVKPLVPAGRG